MEHISSIITEFIVKNMKERGLSLYRTDEEKILALDDLYETCFKIRPRRLGQRLQLRSTLEGGARTCVAKKVQYLVDERRGDQRVHGVRPQPVKE